MRVIKGSAIIDYIIPTVVVGLVVGMGLYYMSSSGLLVKFLAGSSNMQVDMASGTATIGNAGSSGGIVEPKVEGTKGTPEEPVSTCKDGTCTVDFGKFALNGIPEDFASFVATNGAGAGTDKMMELLEQLADIMDDPDTPGDEGKDFRDMANIGHFVARTDRKLEDKLNLDACKKDTFNLGDCSSGLNTAGSADLENISSILTDYTFDTAVDNLKVHDFSSIASQYGTVPFDISKTQEPMYAFYDKFRKIMDNPSYSDNIKKLTQEAFLQVDDIAFNTNAQLYPLYNDPTNVATLTHVDPFTGNLLETIEYAGGTDAAQKTITSILTPEPSKFTDLNSAIICTASKANVDSSRDCHKK